MIDVSKSDWKHFKVIRERALQQLCERALRDVSKIASDASSAPHERYLEIYQKIMDYDKQIGMGFNDSSRSRMLQQLAYIRSLGLIRDDDLSGLSQGVQDAVT